MFVAGSRAQESELASSVSPRSRHQLGMDRDDQTGFEQLASRFRSDLLRYALWFIRDRAAAEDAVQEGLLRAWKAWPQLRDRARAKQWLLKIVRRECARPYERGRIATIEFEELSPADEVLLAIEPNVELSDIQRGIEGLPQSYREPLVLQVLLGYSTKEIAEIMALNQGAVLTRLCRARHALTELLGLNSPTGRPARRSTW